MNVITDLAKNGAPVVRGEPVAPDYLEQWLELSGKFEVPQQVIERKAVGWTRLLIHKWRRPFTGGE